VSATPAPRDLLDFAGRVAVVTGGGRGLGAGLAARFAQAGAAVVVNYRARREEAERAVARITSGGGRARAVQADVSDGSGAERLVEAAVDAFGRLDVLVNNAGIYPVTPLLDMTARQWDEVVDANLRSVHLATQAAARRMIATRTGGAIVNVASIEAHNPAALHSHYCAAKAGVVMHTRSAARELGPHGVRVNSVSPGLIWREGLDTDWPDGVTRYTRAVPLGRLGRADDVADACLFLASPAARWITGSDLVVDGGVLTNTVY
jgi:NAD(P)-dependent dehydrogenase (short-subunit alcohol dehydrogenase family)